MHTDEIVNGEYLQDMLGGVTKQTLRDWSRAGTVSKVKGWDDQYNLFESLRLQNEAHIAKLRRINPHHHTVWEFDQTRRERANPDAYRDADDTQLRNKLKGIIGLEFYWELVASGMINTWSDEKDPCPDDVKFPIAAVETKAPAAKARKGRK